MDAGFQSYEFEKIQGSQRKMENPQTPGSFTRRIPVGTVDEIMAHYHQHTDSDKSSATCWKRQYCRP